MRRIVITAALAAVMATPALASDLNLEQIMANPDWIGHAVESPYWGAHGNRIYYQLKRDGNDIRDLYRVDPHTGKSTRVANDALADADGDPIFDSAHDNAAFIRHGDVFVRHLADNSLQQITRSRKNVDAIQWSADDRRIQYRRGHQWFSYTLDGHGSRQVAPLKTKDAPQDKQRDALERHQMELFSTLRQDEADKKAQRQHKRKLAETDTTRAPEPFWLGADKRIATTALSPDGRWMLVATQPAHYSDGKPSVVNHYVTESGYTRAEKVRPYVGRNTPAPQTVWLLDLQHHDKQALSVDGFAGIHTDPLAKLRKQTRQSLRKSGHKDEAADLKAPDTRAVSITGFLHHPMQWSDDGEIAAIQFRANDNKDRWIATLDPDDGKLDVRDHLHDKAWISWAFNRFGFVPDSHKLWYLNEKTGHSQLYLTALDAGKTRQLTSGDFEVHNPEFTSDGHWAYFKANKADPTRYDIYRVATDGGSMQQVTHLNAINGFQLSPDDSRLAVLHSRSYMLPQLAVVDADGGNERNLTNTMKSDFTDIDWVQPKFVSVPSSHGADDIHAKLYLPDDFDASHQHPAVLFVHGAGYLQDVTHGWSYYFREQMFHNLLTREGYVVLDMDYRASAGYGRDWRAAIYRNMGHPELEDLLDGKTWLADNYHVDPDRVGIYGGSYGGFMTEMALLRAPGEFAAGAALRPPADWRTYNGPYTSDILNTPQLDPKAYDRSSPIEYADNLEDPLLMEHGLIDNNVMASDSLRLYQRFVELHKTDFWISLYPTERHSFEHADAWHDEYRRIHELFTRYLKTSSP